MRWFNKKRETNELESVSADVMIPSQVNHISDRQLQILKENQSTSSSELKSQITSAGLLMYKIENNKVKYFLCKAGGPYYEYSKRPWSIPKGQVEPNEDLISAAKREFTEETSIPIVNESFLVLPIIYTKQNTKKVHIFAFKQNYDIENKPIKSNLIKIEYPQKSGTFIQVPEMIEGRFFSFDEAKDIIFEYQIPLLEHLEYLYLTNGLLI